MSTLQAVNASDATVKELDPEITAVKKNFKYQRKKSNNEGQGFSDSETTGQLSIVIFTTASLPWLTGTAVNPLFRAAYLSRAGRWKVILAVPWLSKSDQETVYPGRLTFESPEEQEIYVMQWLEERVGFKSNFLLIFYHAKFAPDKRSIFPIGDISSLIPDRDACVAVLEEPEHLTWYHHGKRWTKKFQYVIGIIHTNYLEYVKREPSGQIKAFLLKHINIFLTRIHCNLVIRLSDATQEFPKSIVCNVNGVNPKFLEIGNKIEEENIQGSTSFSKGAYYIGKMIWSKGYKELLDLLAMRGLEEFQIDVFGNGEDKIDIEREVKRLNLHVDFHPGIDHSDESIHSYKLLINPSASDVLCTTTAEALAMGKIVLCADHPSNEFFKQFPNCMTYSNSIEFSEKLKKAMSTEPIPLTKEQKYILSWEAATERFLQSSMLKDFLNIEPTSLSQSEGKNILSLSLLINKLKQHLENGLALIHYAAAGKESVRVAAGAIPGTLNCSEGSCKSPSATVSPKKQAIYSRICSCVKSYSNKKQQ